VAALKQRLGAIPMGGPKFPGSPMPGMGPLPGMGSPLPGMKKPHAPAPAKVPEKPPEKEKEKGTYHYLVFIDFKSSTIITSSTLGSLDSGRTGKKPSLRQAFPTYNYSWASYSLVYEAIL
jgi:hypothetical protein